MYWGVSGPIGALKLPLFVDALREKQDRAKRDRLLAGNAQVQRPFQVRRQQLGPSSTCNEMGKYLLFFPFPDVVDCIMPCR
jgi:hypothetical protein